ncbi:MAG: hypothetical protein VX366_02685 [Candidatus Thermoplasmatota archaeon]|nr:hypothetical protein [Euryarchaeota archaeon]MEE2985105.1 hypothetical protein [Candidatus Thermoplasmatota archaeon]|tara:strand:- start:3732 stop:4721 length:990 start_codon:yes stop_codon:yes gene_type:complete
MSPLDNITRVVADSDLDGLMAAAVLKAAKPSIEVHFAHPALIRAGSIDHLIDRNTAICDLPFHENCGLYLDHHQTNRPTKQQQILFEQNGGICHWRDTPSAARAAFDLMKDELDLSHLEEIMPLVDDLDSGGISLSEFMEDGPVIRLSRSLSLKDKNHMQVVLNQFAEGESLDNIIASHQERLSKLETEREAQTELVRKNTTIVDKLAICDLSETGSRSNGYLVTALAGSDAIACCVIHGFIDGTIDNPNRQALGASFYANSFLDEENPYDLSKLATLLDATGGGHANACGCRVQPADKSREMLVETDKDYNLQKWLELWSKRDTLMRQ